MSSSLRGYSGSSTRSEVRRLVVAAQGELRVGLCRIFGRDRRRRAADRRASKVSSVFWTPQAVALVTSGLADGEVSNGSHGVGAGQHAKAKLGEKRSIRAAAGICRSQ